MSTTVGQYIFRRLAQLGSRDVFGVPGDFNMPLLDQLLDTKKLRWVGTCNELNAAYATDGYAREAGVPTAFVTTYGVGEMSAINGVAGSNVENVPVVHIVGTASREAIEDRPFLHHSPAQVGEKSANYLDYVESAKYFCAAHEVLGDLGKVAEQVDRLYKVALESRRPVCLYVPVDTVALKIPSKPLETPITVPSRDPKKSEKVAQAIIEAFKTSKTSVIIADALAIRFRLSKKLDELIAKTGSYGAVTLLGKGALDETSPNFLGCYTGSTSLGKIIDTVENADFVLDVGGLHTDYNTGVFSRNIKESSYIEILPTFSKVRGKKFENVDFEDVIDIVLKGFEGAEAKVPPTVDISVKLPTNGPIKSDDFMYMVGDMLKPNDTLIVETGSLQTSAGNTRLPKGGYFFTQCGYGSIGYALPAAVGAAVANKSYSPNDRVVLVEGDGSAMLTVQDLSTAIRQKVKLVVFLINNDGYLIERALHGPEQEYNDIPSWDWTTLFTALGPKGATKSYQAKTVEEFNKIVKDPEFINADVPILVEVFTGKFDYPRALTALAKANNDRNAKMDAEWASRHDTPDETPAGSPKPE